jgi:LacI family transcriptional regulator
MSTIQDVANRAGVSKATVSRVLNDYQYINKETRERVQKAIEELNYSPSNLARGMRLKRTQTIGLLVADISNPFYSETAKAVINLANSYGYAVILGATDDKMKNEADFISILKQHQVDGFIFASVLLKDTPAKQLISSGVPTFLLNRRFSENRNVNYVVLDNQSGTYMAVEHLVKLGHRRIGFIRGHNLFSTSKERFQGYMNAVKDYNLDSDDSLIQLGNFNEKQAHQATLNLINLPSPPSAIVAANDLMAFSAMGAITNMGLRIPDDIALVGFDDVEMAHNSFIQLTTVTQNMHAMAEIATRTLIQIIEGGQVQVPVQVVLKPQLIVRRTCGARLKETGR